MPALTVRCPSCKRYMLAEDADRGHFARCLLCKSPVPVPAFDDDLLEVSDTVPDGLPAARPLPPP